MRWWIRLLSTTVAFRAEHSGWGIHTVVLSRYAVVVESTVAVKRRVHLASLKKALCPQNNNKAMTGSEGEDRK